MNRFSWLLAVALVSGAGSVPCWAATPAAPDQTAQATRLPPTTSEGPATDAADSPPEEKPQATRVVSLADYQELIGADEATVTPVASAGPLAATWLSEATWYMRADYFFWGEVVDGVTFMKNNGAVPTLGYQKRRGRQRVRAELFGGRVDYFAEIDDLDVSNVTDYLGLRGEYEVLFEPQTWPNLSLFAGMGTRFFVRSFPDIIVAGPTLVDGYQESWWTFYPYLGIEKRRTVTPRWEFYGRGRVGLTAFTWEHVTLNDVTLFPRPNVTVLSEFGLRGPRWHVGTYFELMAWSRSPKVLAYDGSMYVYEVRQPNSANIFLGLKAGFSY